ncbi:hypothetical protein BRCON_1388 [Candidatus Sumerlaea chitinivorans]|uniref:Uncharacterized protein n=1 Tax=Sumerlaea chitinivorans TaxID=2250252 RepID=A0A2Z4Y6Y8_SUMC1|nr:hypothetical protein BRCON_1388 [Candidatus Sumerlaea chitinivorans]
MNDNEPQISEKCISWMQSLWVCQAVRKNKKHGGRDLLSPATRWIGDSSASDLPRMRRLD